MICNTCGKDRPDSDFKLSYINKHKDGTEKPIYRKKCAKCFSNFNMEHYPRKYNPAMGKLESTKRAIKKWFVAHPDYHRNRTEALVDSIVTKSFKRDGLEAFKNNKEFIQLKRAQLRLKRTIKSISKI